MASAVTTPLERQFGQMPSLDADDVACRASAARRSRCSSRSIATSTPPSRTCRPRSTPRRTCCRARCPRRRPTAKSNPADTADPHARGAAPTTLPLAQVDDFADSVLAQKISQVSGVGLVTIGRRPEARGARAGRSGRARRHRARRSRTCGSAIAAANVNQPKGNLDGPRQDYALATNDQLADAASFRAAGASRTQRRAGAARATSPT